MRVGLISCSKTKLSFAAPAAELYTGDLFKLSRDWLLVPRPRVDEWGILSAKHGLVLPDQVLEPYDLSLIDVTDEEHRAWVDRVHGQLMARWGDQAIYTVILGSTYGYAVKRMPFVEDQIGIWSRRRKEDGLRTPFGIGLLKRTLKTEIAARGTP